MLSLGEAARLTGKGKSTIARAIARGELSATRKPDGSYRVDPAELARVYEIKTPETVPLVHHATPSRDPETEARFAALETELRGLRELLSEVRQARDDWKGQAQRLTLALPAPAEPQAESPRRWWRWGR